MGVSAVRFAVGTAITRTDIPALCARLADLLRGRVGKPVECGRAGNPVECRQSGELVACGRVGELVECDVGGLAAPDVVAVEAVARLRMTARRHGRRLIVVGAGPDLRLLFDLLGLAELLTPETTGCARREEAGDADAERSRGEETGDTENGRSQPREAGTGGAGTAQAGTAQAGTAERGAGGA